MEISPPSRSMTWRISAKKRFRFSSSRATWSEYVQQLHVLRRSERAHAMIQFVLDVHKAVPGRDLRALARLLFAVDLVVPRARHVHRVHLLQGLVHLRAVRVPVRVVREPRERPARLEHPVDLRVPDLLRNPVERRGRVDQVVRPFLERRVLKLPRHRGKIREVPELLPADRRQLRAVLHRRHLTARLQHRPRRLARPDPDLHRAAACLHRLVREQVLVQFLRIPRAHAVVELCPRVERPFESFDNRHGFPLLSR